MASEWITRCEDCPMWDSVPLDRRGPWSTDSGPRGVNPDGYCLARPGRQDFASVGIGCAEPLRMAIAAGYLSVSAMTEAMGRREVDVPMSQNIERIANKMGRQ